MHMEAQGLHFTCANTTFRNCLFFVCGEFCRSNQLRSLGLVASSSIRLLHLTDQTFHI